MADQQAKDTKEEQKNEKVSVPLLKQSTLFLTRVPSEIKSQIVSSKPASKQRRISSAGEEDSSEIEEIKCALASIQLSIQKIVTKDDIREIVRSVVADFKEDLKKELQEELTVSIKEEILKDIKSEIQEELKSQKEQYTEDVAKIRKQLTDKVDGLMMDNDTNMENVSKLKKQISKLETKLKTVNELANTAVSMANFNQQYSQKNNIKILNWPERQGQKLKEFCTIVAQRTGITLDVREILAIHRIPSSDKQHPRPVIVKFNTAEARKSVITKRETLKDDFIMLDHITSMNAQLLRTLKAENKQHLVDSAWYFNGHIFVLDRSGHRHRIDVMDNIDQILRA
ncbi:uncharacterized protein LOC133173609 [Saccostrea echinata]|uniref:uncharacterized protein LOC133173609 n=1 Tax=Saccostrea echinata TaxID=191078 RepID=UPI002A7FA538|nr:uncharacterized protein LOC133173609 [Saccostrea echinata]